MAKGLKILLSSLLLLLVLFGHGKSISTGNAPLSACMQYAQPQHLREYHKAFNPSDKNHEHAVSKLKIRTRYKGGEMPFVCIEHIFTPCIAASPQIVCVPVYREGFPRIRSFAVALRGPPSAIPS